MQSIQPSNTQMYFVYVYVLIIKTILMNLNDKFRWSPYSYQNNMEKYEVKKIHNTNRIYIDI